MKSHNIKSILEYIEFLEKTQPIKSYTSKQEMTEEDYKQIIYSETPPIKEKTLIDYYKSIVFFSKCIKNKTPAMRVNLIDKEFGDIVRRYVRDKQKKLGRSHGKNAHKFKFKGTSNQILSSFIDVSPRYYQNCRSIMKKSSYLWNQCLYDNLSPYTALQVYKKSNLISNQK